MRRGDTVFRVGSDGLNTRGVFGTVVGTWAAFGEVAVRDDSGLLWWGMADSWVVVEHSVRVGGR